MNIPNLIIMIIVGAIAGTLAARLVKKDSFGFIVNAFLGIAGAIVGGYVFDFLKWSPGGAIAAKISETFSVNLPARPVDMIVSATVGAVLILIFFNLFERRRNRKN